MIVPWLRGFIAWQRAPITWAIIIFNILIFMATMENVERPTSNDFVTAENLVLTGHLYQQFHQSKREDQSLPIMSTNEWMILGGQALRDSRFLEQVEQFSFRGDQIAIQIWRQKLASYQGQLQERSSQIYGLHSEKSTIQSWITYQFMHASWMHVLGNMIFFLIFGAALESLIGGLGLLGVYLLSGFAGAGLFILLAQGNMAPMVGASGSLSGVMAFYAMFEKKRRVPFFYFFSPFQGFFGWIYLPTLLIFPLCFLTDFANYLSTPGEIGAGIAYTAHMGGVLFGITAGYALKIVRRHLWVRWLNEF